MDQNDKVVPLEEALNLLLHNVQQTPDSEIVALDDALDRISSENIHAPCDLPPFDRSPLDGYAVRAVDTRGAAQRIPAVLQVIEEVYAGAAPAAEVGIGQAVRIMTGAPIPAGADCIVRQEDTDYGGKTVQIFVEHQPHQNFCPKGSDIQQGIHFIQQGDTLDYVRVGMLASLGINQVPVYRRPVVGVLTTGDELVELGRQLQPGKIFNSNQHLLQARIRSLGAVPQIIPRCRDHAEDIAQALISSFADCDFLITTGGVSVGKKDFMPDVCRLLDETPLFHGIPMKPGSPAMAFMHNGKCILCLSGNPFAAAATFELLARPVITRLQGKSAVSPQREAGILQNPFSKSSHSRRFIRARISDGKVYLPVGGSETHSSGSLMSMIDCNCMIDIPANSSPLIPGQKVTVILI